MLTQSTIARETKLSKSVVSDNVKAGAPLTSVEAFRQWRRSNVLEKWNHKDHASKPVPSLDTSRKLTHEEFAALVKSEFERFEAECPKRKKNMPLSFSPSLMIAVWAIKGCMVYGKSDKTEVPLFYVNSFMESLREGDGDLLFKGLAQFENEELSAEFLAEVIRDEKN